MRSTLDAIMIAVDVEPSGEGEKAARTLAERWLEARKRVTLLYPLPPKSEKKFDLNDVVRADGGPVKDGNYRVEIFEAWNRAPNPARAPALASRERFLTQRTRCNRPAASPPTSLQIQMGCERFTVIGAGSGCGQAHANLPA